VLPTDMTGIRDRALNVGFFCKAHVGLSVRKSKQTCPNAPFPRKSSRSVKSTFHWADQLGADGGTRTLTTLPSQDFKSCVSTGSTTSAPVGLMASRTAKRNSPDANSEYQIGFLSPGGGAAGAMSKTWRAFFIRASSSSGLSASNE
jgi:hypothetical protein